MDAGSLRDRRGPTGHESNSGSVEPDVCWVRHVGASGRRAPRACAVGFRRQRPAGVVLETVVGPAQADEVVLGGRAVGKAHDMIEFAPARGDTAPREPT